MKEAIVEQQIKISKLKRQDLSNLSNLPAAAAVHEPHSPKGPDTADTTARITETVERAEQEAKEQAEESAREKMDKVARRRAEREEARRAEQMAEEEAEREKQERAEEAARVKAERIAKRKAEKAAKEQAEREAKERAEREAREQAEWEAREKVEREVKEMAGRREKERLERDEKEEKEQAEKEAEKVEREAKEGEERKKVPVSKSPSIWGSTVEKNDRSRKTSGLSQMEQKDERVNTCDLNSTDREKEDRSSLLPITTSSASGCFDNVGKSVFLSGKKDLPDGAEELELRTPLTKKGKSINALSSLSKTVTLTETTDFGKLDMIEGLNTNVSARISIPPRSENERWTDAEQGPSPTEPTPPALAPGPGLETLSSFASEFLTPPNEAKDEALATPKPWPAPSLTPASQSPLPAPAKIEPEKPLSLWERKKLKVANPPAPASSLFGGGDRANSSGIWGDISGGRGNIESITVPAIAGDRQSIFADTTRDQKRENQRENVVEGFLGSSPARRRNDSAQSQMTTKPTPQKTSGWGSWGSSLLTNIASAVDDRSPSPEPPAVKPKIVDPPRGFAQSQPPKSQLAGFGSSNKPAWGTGGGLGDSNEWGAVKPGPTPIAQKTSTGPAWGAKPMGSALGSGGSSWGSGTGLAFGSGVDKNLAVDAATKPLESSPNPAGLEVVPESVVEIKHVPAPGGFGSAQNGAWGWVETTETEGSKKTFRDSSPIREIVPKSQTEETATPSEEDEFDWTNTKKKRQVVSVANTPSVPDTLGPGNAYDGPGGGTGSGKRAKKKGKR